MSIGPPKTKKDFTLQMTFLCLSFFELPSDDTNTNIQSVNTKRVHHETKSVFEKTFQKKIKKINFHNRKKIFYLQFLTKNLHPYSHLSNVFDHQLYDNAL